MKTYILSLLSKTWKTFWSLAIIMLPIMLLVKIAKDLGAIAYISPFLEPVTNLMGLPPEAGIVWATAMLTNLYGGVGALPVLAGLEMTNAQISILFAAMLIAHALPVEQTIIKKAGTSFLFSTFLRVGTAIGYGILISWICNQTGFLSEPADLVAFKHLARETTGYLDWAIASSQSLFMVLVIIFILYIALDLLEISGVTKVLLKALSPLLRFSGLNDQTTPITTIGVLLGITYGSGLIIQKVKEEQIESKPLFLSLCWLCLSHALIEDTLLMFALGGDIWVILIGRILITLIIIKVLASIIASDRWKQPDNTKRSA